MVNHSYAAVFGAATPHKHEDSVGTPSTVSSEHFENLEASFTAWSPSSHSTGSSMPPSPAAPVPSRGSSVLEQLGLLELKQQMPIPEQTQQVPVASLLATAPAAWASTSVPHEACDSAYCSASSPFAVPASLWSNPANDTTTLDADIMSYERFSLFSSLENNWNDWQFNMPKEVLDSEPSCGDTGAAAALSLQLQRGAPGLAAPPGFPSLSSLLPACSSACGMPPGLSCVPPQDAEPEELLTAEGAWISNELLNELDMCGDDFLSGFQATCRKSSGLDFSTTSAACLRDALPQTF